MRTKIRFTLVHPLVGKGRPKFSTHGGFVHTYNPEKTSEYEKKVKEAFYKKVDYDYDIFTGPLRVSIIAYHHIPKSTSNKKRKLMLDKKILPTVKPDADNIIKIILDALNKVAYHDDNQIVEVRFKKFYYNTSGIAVEIEPILNDDDLEQLRL